MTLESDKATMDVPSPAAGMVAEVLRQGRRQGVDGRRSIATLERGGRRAGPGRGRRAARAGSSEPPCGRRRACAPTPPPCAPPAARRRARRPQPDFAGVYAGPAVRRLARELGLDLNAIKGTGEKGRITREDVEGARSPAAPGARQAGRALPAVPTVDFAKFGPIETVPLSRIKRISGPRLHASWVNVPHVTHTDEADITELEAFRKALDEDAKKDKSKPYRVSLLPLLMQRCGRGAEGVPDLQRRFEPGRRRA